MCSPVSVIAMPWQIIFALTVDNETVRKNTLLNAIESSSLPLFFLLEQQRRIIEGGGGGGKVIGTRGGERFGLSSVGDKKMLETICRTWPESRNFWVRKSFGKEEEEEEEEEGIGAAG